MKYNLKITNKFKRDLKRVKKRGYNLNLLYEIVEMLRKGEQLPEKYHDHILIGNHGGYRDCHITNDWVLIYLIEDDFMSLTLSETGTHSDLDL